MAYDTWESETEEDSTDTAAKTVINMLVLYKKGFKKAYLGSELNAQIT